MSAPDSRTAPDEPEPTPPGVGLLPDRLARADDAARRLLARGVFSAVSLAVSRRGALVHERFFGTTRYAGSAPVTARSLFAIASVTKPLAAAAVMLLLERGLFHLGTPVTDLVPDFGHKGKKDVTVEHLLTHTSGITSGGSTPYPAAPATSTARASGRRPSYGRLGATSPTAAPPSARS
ncbi:MAG: serine hydrolase domain-containing protein, partial [Geminicoccales bacterium]